MPETTLNPRSTILGFDFGLKRIGLAVGQFLTKTATPLTVIIAHQGEPQWNEIDKIIREWQPSALVVGLPLNMDGTSQPITELAKKFAERLQERYQLPIYTSDERLTTREARDQIFQEGGYRALRSGPVDGVAAQIILEGWLQSDEPL